MSTDGAVLVSQRILNGEKIEDIDFCPFPLEIQVSERETVELPFKYTKNIDGTANMPAGLLEHACADFRITAGEEGVDNDWVLNKDDVIDADYKGVHC
jgi:ribosome biogenesis SPOUT family RNA methylase Rps3